MLWQVDRFGWDPFAEMRRMQEDMNRIFSDFDSRMGWRGYPPVNLSVEDDRLTVTAELPGVSHEDLDISVEDRALTLSGKRSPGDTDDSFNWLRRERPEGTFVRVIDLPFRVDPDSVEAHLSNGVLEVVLKQRPEDRPKKVEIKAG